MKLASILTALLLVAGSAHAQAIFTRLGLPPGEEPQNPAFSDAYGVSNTGVVVGSMYVPNVGFRSFRWTAATGLVQVNGINPESQIFARAITPDSLVIIGENTSPQLGFRIVGANPIEGMPFPNDIDYDASSAADVSDDGNVAVGLLSRVEDGTFRMARWAAGQGWTDLGALGGDYESAGNAISADGTILAGYSVGATFTAVKWTQTDGLVALPSPFNSFGNSTAIAMSASGHVIVGQAADGAGLQQAVLWRADGTSTGLPRTDGLNSAAAFGVSGDGNVIGGTQFIENVGDDTATFWVGDSAVYHLKDYLTAQGNNLTGWTLSAITEVSQNGRYLVGRGLNPDGLLESFIVELASLPVVCDTIDFNGNGVFPEDQDVIDFFNVLAGADCPTGTCNDIDFNNNGVFPEDQDVVDFFNVLAGGTCP